jgi:hypothetical protein
LFFRAPPIFREPWRHDAAQALGIGRKADEELQAQTFCTTRTIEIGQKFAPRINTMRFLAAVI